MALPYSTISDVLAQMDQVIAKCIQRRSKLGYFAVLYRHVTLRVRLTASRTPARAKFKDTRARGN
ncbi:MAG: DUF5995 family protein [Anaerolineales bacterium]